MTPPVPVTTIAADGDAVGAAIWHRVIDAIGQLTSTTAPGAGALIGTRLRRRSVIRGGVFRLAAKAEERPHRVMVSRRSPSRARTAR